MGRVCISGYAREVLASEDQGVSIDKSGRRLMRFARKSGKMFLKALIEAIKVSDLKLNDTDPRRMMLFFSDSMNISPDALKVAESIDALRRNCDAYSEASHVEYIADNWSVIEALQGVPNIPTFLACKEYEIHGASSTELSSCAGGLLTLIDGYELIHSGGADIVFVGAASEKMSFFENQILRSMGFFGNGDYSIINGSAVIILESEEHVKKRSGKIYAFLCDYGTSFSPETYLWRLFDINSIRFILDRYCPNCSYLPAYVSGSFSRKLLSQELKLLSGYPFHVIESESFKSKYGYTFAASGLMEIIHLIANHFSGHTIVNTFAMSGQNASVIIEINPPEGATVA